MPNENKIDPIVATFLGLLAIANSIAVTDDVLTSTWEVSTPNGDPYNEVVCITWQDEGVDCSMKLTEGGISSGEWGGESFFCHDSEGDEVQLSLYNHVALVPQDSREADAGSEPIQSAVSREILNVPHAIEKSGYSGDFIVVSSIQTTAVVHTAFDKAELTEALRKAAEDGKPAARHLMAKAIGAAFRRVVNDLSDEEITDFFADKIDLVAVNDDKDQPLYLS